MDEEKSDAPETGVEGVDVPLPAPTQNSGWTLPSGQPIPKAAKDYGFTGKF